MRVVIESDTGIALLWDASLFPDKPAALKAAKSYEKLAQEGKLFWFNMGGNGECPIDVHIGEPLPAHKTDLDCRKARGLLLELPSGRIGFGGLEHLHKPAETLTIEPGRYLVDAIVPDQDENEEANPTDPVAITGCILAILAGIGFAGALVTNHWLIPLIVIGVAAVFWTVYLLWYNLSGARAKDEAKKVERSKKGSPFLAVALNPALDTVTKGGGVSV
jgi:hypothetical protein